MGHGQEPGVGADQGRDVCRVQVSIPVAGDAVKSDPLFCQVVERPHDGIVLHAADQAVVSRTQPAPQHHVQSHSVAGGEDAVGGITVVKETAQALPQHQGGHAGSLGAAVDAPVDGSAHLGHVLQHGLGNGGRLGKGCGSIVKIDRVHGVLLR